MALSPQWRSRRSSSQKDARPSAQAGNCALGVLVLGAGGGYTGKLTNSLVRSSQTPSSAPPAWHSQVLPSPAPEATGARTGQHSPGEQRCQQVPPRHLGCWRSLQPGVPAGPRNTGCQAETALACPRSALTALWEVLHTPSSPSTHAGTGSAFQAASSQREQTREKAL